jgi:hypothetical protein
MGVEFAAERRLLGENEFEPVVRSHYPMVGLLTRTELVELAVWLRQQRDRVRDLSRKQVRQRRGKADGSAPPVASERGLANKKQVFTRALKRVNARLEQFRTEAQRERAVDALRAALARRQGAEVHHPDAGTTAGGGLRSRESHRRRTNVPPSKIGSVSQAGRNSQAQRDSRG